MVSDLIHVKYATELLNTSEEATEIAIDEEPLQANVITEVTPSTLESRVRPGESRFYNEEEDTEESLDSL